MEPKDFYDLFYIAIIAFVIARFLKRRQAAEARQRERELDAEAMQAEGEAPAGAGLHDGTGAPDGLHGAEAVAQGADRSADPAAPDRPAETGDRRDPDDRAGPG